MAMVPSGIAHSKSSTRIATFACHVPATGTVRPSISRAFDAGWRHDAPTRPVLCQVPIQAQGLVSPEAAFPARGRWK